MEHEESLQTGASVRQTAHSIERQVDDLLANRVVTARVVVRRVLLARDQLLRMEQRPIRPRTYFVYNPRSFSLYSMSVGAHR